MEDCETNDCRKEKRGCKGCYYENKNIDKDTKKFLDNMGNRLKLAKENGCKLLDCKTIDNNIKLRLENIKLRKELETYKKIAENLLEVSDEEKAEAYFQEYIGKNNEDYDEFDYFFEKARKEVENGS